MTKPELLAPAGNLSKLKLALYYGADAVYLGGKAFSLRSSADNFTEEELEEGVRYAHARGKKVYVAANIFAKNADFPALEALFRRLEALHADGVLVSDLGVFRLAKRVAPRLPLHISTQANTLNKEAAAFWYEQGARRVVLARETTAEEIAEIHAAVPALELEAFVHGAMCISYSGRCYLSDYLEGRSSNRGACAQPCRYRFRLQAEGKEGWYDLEEDGKGSYLLNSKDLNMLAHLRELAAAGVSSFKIEGRTKGEYYLATVVNAYRRAMDGGDTEMCSRELLSAAHRAYTTAYDLKKGGQSVETSQTSGTHAFIGLVTGHEKGRVFVEMRGRFFEGEELEIVSPSALFGKKIKVDALRDSENNPCTDAKKVQEIYSFSCPYPLSQGDILRKKL